ncbi:DUF1998 domain-containing protein [Pontibacter sp. HSC-14F20]|uniref:DUF1998 domain-containing protein n=1 Tax=Pontibacter sp. HSC-14F20 TaxID=2864136 RepID=UPI001C729DDE|nr:DUF1998 domain-containing protein [Pontibacter sp. HSC-14F20]MBX0335566.1 DUF1998 domain-containing protein [Pontibacter sp. HSC-14F20]
MAYEEIQNRKLISAYGGIGSLIETRNGAVKINELNEWPYYDTKQHLRPDNHVIDERFKARLKLHFPQLQHLVRLPENQLTNGIYPQNLRNLVSANYFPKWMYCPSCHSFDDVDNWRRHWENTVQQNHRDKFDPPKCFKCYVASDKKNKFFDLEQVRFVMTSPSGNIVDIPWKHWVMRKHGTSDAENTVIVDEDDTNITILDLDAIHVPDDIELKYQTSSRLGDLKGIRIEAYQKGKRIASTTLSGIFNLRIWENKHPDIQAGPAQLKTVLRSSNSVYYPNIAQSIFLPLENIIDSKVIEKIRSKHKRGRSTEIIWEDLVEEDGVTITQDTVQAIIDNNFAPTVPAAKSEEQYRWEEYKFITDQNNFRHKDLIFRSVPEAFYNIPEINSIHRIDRLRVTAVQTAYTRQRPIDKDLYLNTDLDGDIKRKYTTTFGERTFYLPAYESYGEGIFIDINDELLQIWEQDSTVQERVNIISHNFKNSFQSQNQNKTISPRFVLIHTLSHLLIKELEFLCGYSAASLQERLYVSNNMHGLLIYTVAGAEGSFGGLVSICKSDKIGILIRAALDRAKDCASDPICYHTDQQGQGTAGLNLAACYSCGLLPETSCEEMNSFLDRALVMDPTYGFLKKY